MKPQREGGSPSRRIEQNSSVMNHPSSAPTTPVKDDDWIAGFFGTSGRGDDDSHSLPDAPPPTPDRELASAIYEASMVSARPRPPPPRLNPPPTSTGTTTTATMMKRPALGSAPPYMTTSAIASRRRLAVPSEPIGGAQRQYYNQLSHHLYSGGGTGSGLVVLAKAAGKRTKPTAKKAGKTRRVVKTKKHGKGRRSLSQSWPSAQDGFSSSSMYQDDDYQRERQAERAEMERGDRK